MAKAAKTAIKKDPKQAAEAKNYTKVIKAVHARFSRPHQDGPGLYYAEPRRASWRCPARDKPYDTSQLWPRSRRSGYACRTTLRRDVWGSNWSIERVVWSGWH